MANSAFKKATDHLQASLRPIMAEHGFRSTGRTFRRLTGDGLTQLVNLQMGPFDPPGMTYIPGLRENLYGAVAINLGVFVPELAEWDIGGLPKSSVLPQHCALRARLGQLGPEQRDLWWNLEKGPLIEADIVGRVLADALPWLDGLMNRDDILRAMEDRDAVRSGTTIPRIVSAIILLMRGDKERARQLLSRQALESERNHPHHARHVRDLARRLGLPALDA